MVDIPIIDQSISAVAPVLHRDTINPTNPATQDAFVQSVETFFDTISDTTVNEINQVTTKIDTTVAAMNIVAQEVSEAATIAIASGQYKGEWEAGFETTGYSLGDGVTFTDGYNYVSKINNNLSTPVTLTNTSQWNFIEAVNPNNYYLKTEIDTLYEINNKTNKTTPIDTDNILIQEIGGLFKKLSWSNLKNTLFNLGISTPSISWKSTLVTINSWSYSGTTITLNVTSHTFIAGDYIETTGLTSTTNAPNGIYLVTSVTTGTIVFTAYATPTGTAGVSTARVKGFTTVNGKLPVLINAGANTSLSANGYDKLPSGVIIQWGSYTSSSSADSNITFPIAFPNSTQIILGLVQGSPSQGVFTSLGATGKSLTSFYMGSWSSNSSRVSTPTFWIAIGC